MSQSNFDRFSAWAVPYLPERFRGGPLPYLFSVVWLLIFVLLILAYITPYPNGISVPLAYVLLLLIVQMLYINGLSMQMTMSIALVGAVVVINYAAWTSGGIFSPRMAWLACVPLIPFYATGKKSGFIWLGIICLDELLMAYITWRGWLPQDHGLGVSQNFFSFVSYTVVTFILMTVPFLYDNLFRKTYKASLQRYKELEEKRQELIRASHIREQFLATVSHELRTPMNAILGFNNMLLGRVTDNPQALKILNHTRQSADHLLTVINDVLDYSQLQAGKIKVQPETFSLRDTVHTAFHLFEQRVESMHVNYTCTFDDNVPYWVRADRHRLMQVLVNLLGNAIKFTHQGHVALRVRREPLCVHFSVSDSGIGIAKAQQAKIFQRFGQANELIQSRYGGNGLGLSITQRLVELMGGHVGFQSTEGVGSQFWFTLPLVEVPPPEAEPTVEQRQLETLETPQRFLVVDDHPLNRLLVRQILTTRWKNCDIVEADNGIKALACLKYQNFDVILMDMVMPEMDGIEATRALRASELQHTRETPVLGLTANVNPVDLESFTTAGVNAVVLKPFEAAKVCAQIEHMLTERKSSQGS
jgi:signal transduction histidine kinase/ActR/RegA family two-component response regulator